jgi:hypothetical protein
MCQNGSIALGYVRGEVDRKHSDRFDANYDDQLRRRTVVWTKDRYRPRKFSLSWLRPEGQSRYLL